VTNDRRSTTDVLVLMIAGTICGVVLLTIAGVVLIELINPEADTSEAAAGVGGIVSTLIGLLAGFLAGRTQSRALQRGDNNVDG
jgi:hypothetical protein